ncbi:MAG: hypothetical protein KDC38_09640, partial [Planctomycetes bacterium]|nr:hypothetical protein [Planctomycetota bacterium]
MTTDLHAIRQQAMDEAAATGTIVTLALTTKTVNFGSITAFPDGSLDLSGIDGVDDDLIIKPFHQKGAVISLREFANNAYNHHHGMQSEERFGVGIDRDNDGVVNELTTGDITAASLYQATLPPPGRVLPNDATVAAAVTLGESLFTMSIADGGFGCAGCHIPSLRLENAVFTEPNPYNPKGNLRVQDVAHSVAVDLSTEGPLPRLPEEVDGTVLVPLFSDLKRHDLGSGGPFDLNNEMLEQSGIPTSQWLTRKLWGMANEPPFMHHGRCLTISEAIQAHGGDAQESRDAWLTGTADEQDAVVEFLKTFRVLPEEATSLTQFEDGSGIIGDEPAIAEHLDQAQIEAGLVSFDAVFEQGKRLFRASFNTLDGFGRPEATGTGAPRARREGNQRFNRISAPDANSCSGCHNVPRSGGGGDNVANVFVLAQRMPFVNFDGGAGDQFEDHTLLGVGNERNTLGMFGAGYIELLAREMSSDLRTIREQALVDAIASGTAVTRSLVTKGVSFGEITGHPDGSLDTSGVEGVDADLVIKPFHQKGAVVSLREFSNNAYNHHHGMQSSERFGAGVDQDADGLADELTVGDITAAAVYQAALAVPGRVLPIDPIARADVFRGEALFTEIGCATCHIPTLRLESPMFSEPNPFNPPGNLRPGDVMQPYEFDLTIEGQTPRLGRQTDGSVLVPAFTDLKRHDMGPELNNEELLQAGIPSNLWLTRKLWGMANEPPYLHHGRALLISDAILAHGGEAEDARVRFTRLPTADRARIVAFLKTLQVLPEGETQLVVEK